VIGDGEVSSLSSLSLSPLSFSSVVANSSVLMGVVIVLGVDAVVVMEEEDNDGADEVVKALICFI